MKSVAEAIHHAQTRQALQLITVGESTSVVVMWENYQLRLAPDGPYHRHGTILHQTACGLLTPRDVGVLRAHKLDDKLCVDCFSAHELELGREFARKRDE